MTLRQSYRTCDLTEAAKSAIFCGLQRIFMDRGQSRVKRCAAANIGGNALSFGEQKPERSANKTGFAGSFTAILPRPSNAAIIADLNRAKVAFQIRAVAAAMGLPFRSIDGEMGNG